MDEAITDYLRLVGRLPRLLRVLHDTIEDEFLRTKTGQGLTAVQALILHNMGENTYSPAELLKRGIYCGSNPSYNVRALKAAGYIEDGDPDPDDRRRATIRITATGREIQKLLAGLFVRQAESLELQDIEMMRKATLLLEANFLKGIRHLY